MTFRDVSAPIRSIWPAVFASLGLLLAGALSVISVSLFGQVASFAFLPLIVLAIWPRRANELASIAFIFLAGLFTDWASGGVPGQWVLVYTLVWMLFRPEMRDQPYAILRFIVIWILICGFATIILSLSGWVIYRVLPDFSAFAFQFVAASLPLPIILLLRHWLAHLSGDAESRGR